MEGIQNAVNLFLLGEMSRCLFKKAAASGVLRVLWSATIDGKRLSQETMSMLFTLLLVFEFLTYQKNVRTELHVTG